MSTENKNRIIEYIRKNRVSTTELADCLDKTGAVRGVHALNPGHFRVGNVFWAYAYGGSNWHVHDQIQSVQEGDVVFVEAFDCEDRAIFGDLVAKYLLLYRQAAAVVVTGAIRDTHRLLKENWPIWCNGSNPEGCFNTNIPVNIDSKILESRRKDVHGTIGVCDDTGVVLIPKEHHTPSFLKRVEEIELQEDIWYDCVDRKKWSTFDAICLKRYLTE